MVVLRPACFELFQRMGLGQALRSRGVRLSGARAFSKGRALDRATFGGEEDFPVLALPLFDLRTILEEHLYRVQPGSVLRDTQLLSFTEHKDGLVALYQIAGGTQAEIAAGFLVGTDGPRSRVREQTRIPIVTEESTDAFITGNFSDRTDFGSEARIFVDEAGFIECIPMPGGLRRWVLQTPTLVANPGEGEFCRAVKKRAGVDLQDSLNSLLTTFRVEHYAARELTRGRALLAGESAHAISQVGGQGVNIALMDALDGAGALHHIYESKVSIEVELHAYAEKSASRAKSEIEKLHDMLAFGRHGARTLLGRAGVNLLLRRPGKKYASSFFTFKKG